MTTRTNHSTSLLCVFLVVLTILASFQGYTILQERGIIINTNTSSTTTTTSISTNNNNMRRSRNVKTSSSSSSLPPPSFLLQQQQQQQGQPQTLPLNPDATLAEDIVSIEHYYGSAANSTEGKGQSLVVTLKKNAKCYRPYLIGRLSGPTLIKIDDWIYYHDSSKEQQQHVMIGTYQLPKPSSSFPITSTSTSYYVEILALYCDHFFYDYLQQQQQQQEEEEEDKSDPAEQLRSFDFKIVCMEDPSNQRLTSNDAAITIDAASIFSKSSYNSTSWTGYWVHNNYNRQQQKRQQQRQTEEEGNDQQVQPIFTRYQPAACYDGKAINQQPPNMTELSHPECITPMSNPIHSSYSFQWSVGPIRRGHLKQTKPTHLCLVGRSHSRTLIKASKMAGLTIRHQNLNVQYNWIQASFPENVLGNVTSYLQTTQGENQCDYLVLGVGQWPASYKRGSLLADYQKGMSQMIQDLLPLGIPIILRSIHYNPLAWPITSCPPQDWRNPIVIDGYNMALKELATTHNLQFVDTNWLISPIWDASYDWAHVDPTTSIKEVLYLTAKILHVEPTTITMPHQQ